METELVPISLPEAEQRIPTVENVENEPTRSGMPAVKKPTGKLVNAKKCSASGVWIYTKSGMLQICDAELNVTMAIRASAGKSSTPTYPWLYKAQSFKPGYIPTKSGKNLYYSVFFYKGLAIAGVEKVAYMPSTNGSVFIEKKYAKQVYDFIKMNNSLIWVKDR